MLAAVDAAARLYICLSNPLDKEVRTRYGKSTKGSPLRFRLSPCFLHRCAAKIHHVGDLGCCVAKRFFSAFQSDQLA